MDSRFKVIFRGELISTYKVEQVKKNIASLYKVPIAKIETWFSGQPVTVKEGIDYPTANRYKKALERAGIVCYIEEIPSNDKLHGVSQSRSDASEGQPKMFCPKCWLTQPQAQKCIRCGTIVSEYVENQKPEKIELPQKPEKRKRQETSIDITGLLGKTNRQEEFRKQEALSFQEGKDTSNETSVNKNQQMICPQCGFEQPYTEECAYCGIIIKKYLQEKKQEFLQKRQQQTGNKLGQNPVMIVEQPSSEKGTVQRIEHPSQYSQQQVNDVRRKKGIQLVYILMTMIALITLISGVVGYIQYTEYKRNKQVESEKQRQQEEEASRLEKLEQAKATYLVTGKVVIGIMATGAISAVEMCGEISTAWSNSIKRGGDFDYAIRKRIEELDSSNGKTIREAKKVVDVLMGKIDIAPDGMERHREKIFELYGEFNKLCNQALYPSGSLTTFNQSINNSQEKFLQLGNEVKILYKIN